jgi:hypothetical protein
LVLCLLAGATAAQCHHCCVAGQGDCTAAGPEQEEDLSTSKTFIACLTVHAAAGQTCKANLWDAGNWLLGLQIDELLIDTLLVSLASNGVRPESCDPVILWHEA